MKIVCSRCGKIIDDVVIRVESSIVVFKPEPNGMMTPYNNLKEPTSEMLCLDCFDKYAKCLNSLNQDLESNRIANMVEVVDSLQYGDDYVEECITEGESSNA